MPAQTPIRAHRTLQLALQSLVLAGRLMLEILGIGLRGLMFAGAHRSLPPSVRMFSPGFMACSAMFFLAAWMRHGLAGHESGVAVLFGAGLAYAALMVISLSHRVAEFTLCLCISVAADLLAAGLLRVGSPSMDSEFGRTTLLVWPLAAVFVALIQLRLARSALPTMPAA
jgi:uncharacterized membrane protein